MVGQQSVAIEMAAGFPGQFYLSGPQRTQPGEIVSAGTSNPNYVGYAYSYSADGKCNVGGTGDFYGILVNPQNYPLYGNASGPLEPALNLPQYSPGEFCYDSTGIFVQLAAAANVGDPVYYNTTTGAIVTAAGSWPSSGAQRVAIVTATGVATVSLAPAGMPRIGVGSVLTAADGQTLTVTNVLTGTGGNGTYTTVGSTADHAAEAFSIANPATPSGTLRVPGWEVLRFTAAGAGIAVIGSKLKN